METSQVSLFSIESKSKTQIHVFNIQIMVMKTDRTDLEHQSFLCMITGYQFAFHKLSQAQAASASDQKLLTERAQCFWSHTLHTHAILHHKSIFFLWEW